MKRKRVLYLALIRSQFEHCSPVWRPTGKTMLNKFESLQKRCIKWILSEQYLRYGNYQTYVQKCRQVDLLPITKRFEYNDLVLFYKIVYNLISIQLPFFLKFYEGNSRLRSCHLDNLSLVSTLNPKNNVISDSNKNCPLYKSFHYRVHLQWNILPLEIRSLHSLSKFKTQLTKYLWNSTLDDNDSSFMGNEDESFDIE